MNDCLYDVPIVVGKKTVMMGHTTSSSWWFFGLMWLVLSTPWHYGAHSASMTLSLKRHAVSSYRHRGIQQFVEHTEQQEDLYSKPWRELRELYEEDVPIMGPFRELAYFYADAWVGTPPQRFSVIVDTGSALMAFPCKGCKNCGKHEGNRYDYEKSSTAEIVGCQDPDCPRHCSKGTEQCAYHQGYSEGSQLSGLMYRDKAFLDFPSTDEAAQNKYSISYVFGCHKTEIGRLFNDQLADGIIGMANRSPSYIAALRKANKLDDGVFSMCLAFRGGSLKLGGAHTELHAQRIKWTPMQHSVNYAVKIDSVDIEGDVLTNKHHPAIVDSGTTFTMVPRNLFNGLQSKVQSICKLHDRCKNSEKVSVGGESICWRLSKPSDLDTFPSISFSLQDGANIVIGPRHLFVNMTWDNGGKAYCLALYASSGERILLGANAMMNHDFVFDLNKSKLGIAKSNCKQPKNTGNSEGSVPGDPTDDTNGKDTEEHITPVDEPTEKHNVPSDSSENGPTDESNAPDNDQSGEWQEEVPTGEEGDTDQPPQDSGARKEPEEGAPGSDGTSLPEPSIMDQPEYQTQSHHQPPINDGTSSGVTKNAKKVYYSGVKLGIGLGSVALVATLVVLKCRRRSYRFEAVPTENHGDEHGPINYSDV